MIPTILVEQKPMFARQKFITLPGCLRSSPPPPQLLIVSIFFVKFGYPFMVRFGKQNSTTRFFLQISFSFASTAAQHVFVKSLIYGIKIHCSFTNGTPVCCREIGPGNTDKNTSDVESLNLYSLPPVCCCFNLHNV